MLLSARTFGATGAHAPVGEQIPAFRWCLQQRFNSREKRDSCNVAGAFGGNEHHRFALLQIRELDGGSAVQHLLGIPASVRSCPLTTAATSSRAASGGAAVP